MRPPALHYLVVLVIVFVFVLVHHGVMHPGLRSVYSRMHAIRPHPKHFCSCKHRIPHKINSNRMRRLHEQLRAHAKALGGGVSQQSWRRG